MTSAIFLEQLYATILERRREANPETSYVARLSARGLPRIAQKVGEEAVETVIASLQHDKEGVKSESADLLFHLALLWAEAGVTPTEVMDVLEARHHPSAKGAPA